MVIREKKIEIALFIIISLFCLIIIELTLRTLFGFGNPVLYEQHEKIGLNQKPSQILKRIYNADIRINSHGLRYEELSVEKPTDENRIFIIGDSVTWGGEFIGTESLFTNILEKKLNTRVKQEEIRVINAGTNAHSIMNIQAKYEHIIKKLQPDTIIVYVPEGDFYRPHTNLETQFIGPFWNKKPYLALQEVVNYLLQYIKLRIFPSEGFDAKSGPQYIQKNMESLKRIKEDTRDNGIGFYIIITPTREQVEKGGVIKDVYENLINTIPEEDIHYLRDCFNKYKDKDIYKDIIHFLPEGHQVAAECIMQTIGDELIQ